jgi:hypothetical protein
MFCTHRASLLTLSLLAASLPAGATENQSVRALLGAPGQEMTTPQLPGLYGQVWTQSYHAGKFLAEDGKAQSTALGNGVSAVRGGSIDAIAVVPRLTWVSDARLGEGRLGISATLPLVRLDVQTRLDGVFPAGFPSGAADAIRAQLAAASAAKSGTVTGLGDMEIAPFVDFQDDESRLVLLAAVVAPTGDYQASRAVNTGSGNFWTFRPGFLYGRAFENGLEFGTRVTYSFNSPNRDTQVRSGQYLHADASLLYRLNDQWRVGLGGYALKQTTNDEGPGVAADGNKAQIFALGPTVGYQSDSGNWAAEFKLLPEFKVRNRPEGTTGWLRLMFRID